MKLTHLGLALSALLLLLPLTACKEKTPSQEAAAPTAPAAEMQAEGGDGHNHPDFPITGTVAEVHHGAGYSYILLNTESGQQWVATSQIAIEAGEEIGFADGSIMHNFPSKALDRTFDEIIFSSHVIGREGSGHEALPAAADSADSAGAAAPSSFDEAVKGESTSVSSAMQMNDPALQGSGKAVVPTDEAVKVDKATGDNAYTVGELFGKSKELTGKPVLLRAKVLKVSPMIMGKNWLHVQDGTGDPGTNTHDLVVTTAALPAQGDTVTLEGTLQTDRDFGYGYVYGVIVEDAVIK